MRLSRPLAQIALDLVNKDLIKQLAKYSSERGIDIIEIGTPAIKRFGSDIIREIRDLVGRDRLLLADTKTLDASRVEIETISSAGANIATVMGYAPDEVFYEALEAGNEYGVEVWADMMYLSNPVERALRLKELGVKTIILHVGVDVQKRRGVSGEILVNEVRELSSRGLRIAVAGGLDPYKGKKLYESGASIIIIGGWVTRSSDWRSRIDEIVRVFSS